MSRKSLIYFAIVGVLWGIPYLLMKVAVEEFSPAAIVAGRTLIGAAILIPVAVYRKRFIGAVLGYKYVALYALMEMIGPWILISTAEKKIDSGLAGLLISTVPIFSTIIISIRGDHTVWQFKRIFGIVVGFVGLILVVGMPSSISFEPAMSLIALGVLSTAFAFILFFKVLAELGPARSSLVTYVNTAVAVVLGVVILKEPVTIGIIVGLPLVLAGSYMASRKTS